MGLDMVELVMDAEEEFGVRLEDRQLERVRTVGDFAAVVASSLRDNLAAACPTSARFFRLRSAWSSACNVSRRRIRPEAQVRDLFPWWARKRAWHALRGAGLEPPRLRLSAWIKWPLYTACTLGLAVVVLTSFAAPSFISWAVVPLGVTLFAAAALAYQLPRDIKTVADLVQASTGAEPKPVLSKDDLLERVIEFTALQLGLKKELVHANSRFIEDLAAD